MGMEIFDRVPYATREEWLEMRGHGIGGSECSAIVGLNPYKTNLQLWQEKVGIRKTTNVENEHTRYGQACEEALRTIIQADYEGFLKISCSKELLVRKDKPHIRASLDGEIEVLQDCMLVSYHSGNSETAEEEFVLELKKGMRGVLEIKTADILNSIHKEKWGEKIPDNYYCQTLHYLNVTNYDFVILFAQLTTNAKGVKTHLTRTYGYMKSSRVDDLKYLEESIDQFWLNNVQKRIEPPLQINL